MIAYFFQVSLCLGVFYSFYHFALRKESFYHSNRFYLLSTLTISLLIPIIRIPIESLNSHHIFSQATIYAGSYMENFGNQIIYTPTTIAFPWLGILFSLYIVGVAILTVRLAGSIWTIVKLEAKGNRRCFESQPCVISFEIDSPFSFFNTIFFPAAHSFSDAEVKEVILHEKAHVDGRHSWDVLYLEFIGILLWFNPIIYLYRKALKETHEYIADEAAVSISSRSAYMEFLIRQRRERFQNTISSFLFQPSLKNRIMMMSVEKSNVNSKWKYVVVLPMMLTLLIFFSCQKQVSSTEPDNILQASDRAKIDTISLNADLQYFMNGYSISDDQLESAIRTSANHNLERIVILKVDNTSKVKDIDEAMAAGDRVDARMIISINE